MVKAEDIINKAKSFIGTKENPANSNNVIFNTDYYGRAVSGAAYPWCCVFIWYVFRMVGAALLFYGGKKTALCATLANWFKQIGRFYTSDPQVGDIVFYKFGSGGNWTNHVGIVAAVNADGSIQAIEGNTSAGSDANGGAVMLRTRKSNIVGYGRPDYEQNQAQQITYPTIRKGSKGAYVTLLQQRLAAKGYSCGTIDGIFGVKTLEAVKALQVDSGLQTDGIVGAKTWAKVVA